MAEIGVGDTSWIPQRYHLDTSSPWIPHLDNSNCQQTFCQGAIALLTKVTQEVNTIETFQFCLMNKFWTLISASKKLNRFRNIRPFLLVAQAILSIIAVTFLDQHTCIV